MKLGVAISLYNNFHELAILLDILRDNFSQEYIISICCNHPEGRNNIDQSKIDFYSQGQDIRYDKEQNWINNYTAINMRVMDSIKKCCPG